MAAGLAPTDRLRAPGGGDKPLSDKQPGFEVSSRTVLRLLHSLGYSLQANAKVSEGRQHR